VPYNRDYESTIERAESAVRLIKSHRLPADPPGFELWYTYVARYLPALNSAINEALEKGGALSTSDADRIYERYLGSFRFSERIEAIGDEVGKEVDGAVAMIEATINSSDRYSESLAGLSEEIDRTSDRRSLRAIADKLVQTTKAAGDESRDYKARLKAVQSEIKQLKEGLDTIRYERQIDPLSSLANRKQFDQSLEKAIATSGQSAKPLTLLMCDVDHFKEFNDTWGHPLGDDVLRLISVTMKQLTKGQDIPARYGGDEFAIIMPNTKLNDAVVVAEQIRKALMEKPVIQRSTSKILGRITMSIGAAQLQHGDDTRSIVERADWCLYAAKKQGRNRIVWNQGSTEWTAPVEMVGVR
jgi:diguanylate cyclase